MKPASILQHASFLLACRLARLPCAAIRFVLDDLFSALSQEDRRALLHVRPAMGLPVQGCA